MGEKVTGALKLAKSEGELKDLKGEDFRKANDALNEKLKKEHFSEKELEILATGKSNAGFHYMGSSKILGQIGQAFAESMAELLQ